MTKAHKINKYHILKHAHTDHIHVSVIDAQVIGYSTFNKDKHV